MVLKREKWPYQGINNSQLTCKVLCIDCSVVDALRRDHKEIGDVITQQEDYFDIYGVPQIDYTIEMLNSSPSEVQDQIINFQKQYIWKEKRHDYLSMWLEIEKLEQDVEKFNNQEIERENNIHRLLQWCKEQDQLHQSQMKDFQQTQQSNALENLAKAVLDVQKDNEETRSAAKIKFQRTMRRLSILRRFAKRLGLEFDIENMEISLLTKQRGDRPKKGAAGYSQLSELEQEVFNKRCNFEEIANVLQYSSFI